MNVNIMLYPASCFDGRYPVIELVYSPVQLIGNFVQHLDNIIKFFDNTRTYPADDCGKGTEQGGDEHSGCSQKLSFAHHADPLIAPNAIKSVRI